MQKYFCYLGRQISTAISLKLLNQNQACLYLFECILHQDFKYSNEVRQFNMFHCFTNYIEIKPGFESNSEIGSESPHTIMFNFVL